MARSKKIKNTEPEVSISRTSAGLREALFREWDDLREGRSTPGRAQAVANLAKQIVNSVKIEIDFAMHVRSGKDTENIALTAPLQLGEKND